MIHPNGCVGYYLNGGWNGSLLSKFVYAACDATANGLISPMTSHRVWSAGDATVLCCCGGDARPVLQQAAGRGATVPTSHGAAPAATTNCLRWVRQTVSGESDKLSQVSPTNCLRWVRQTVSGEPNKLSQDLWLRDLWLPPARRALIVENALNPYCETHNCSFHFMKSIIGKYNRLVCLWRKLCWSVHIQNDYTTFLIFWTIYDHLTPFPYPQCLISTFIYYDRNKQTKWIT